MLRRSIFVIIAISFLLSCAARRERREQEEALRVQQLLETSASYYAQRGQAALAQSDYEQAISNFRKAVDILPTDSKNHNNLGVSFYKNKQLDSALVYYQNAIRLRSTYAQAYINLGYLYMDKDQFGLAESAARHAFEHEPNAAAFALLGHIFEKQQKFELAEENFQQAVELDPQDAQNFTALATFFYDRGRLDEAIEAYKNAAAIDPQNADTFYNLGNCYARKCHLDPAQEMYEQSLKLDPGMVGALNNHGLILVQTKNYENALSDFYRALNVDSTAAPVLFNISIVLLKVDDPQTALTYINRAIRASSTYPMFYLQRGNIYLALGLTDQALASFKKAVQLDAGYALAYNNIGNTLMETNNAEAAQEAYQRALGLYPDFLQKRYFSQGEQLSSGVGDLFGGCVDALQLTTDYAMMTNNLGKAKMMAGRYEEAKKDFENAIKSQPELAQPYENLAFIYQREGKTAHSKIMMAYARLNQARSMLAADSAQWALEACDQALSFYPDMPPVLALKARIQSKTEPQKAQALIDRAIEVDPNDPTVQFTYANFLAQQHNFEKAAIHADLAVQLDPYHIDYRVLYADIADSLGNKNLASLQRAYSYYLSGKKQELVGHWDLALEDYQTAAGLADDATFLAAQGHIYVKKQLYLEANILLQQALDLNPQHADALYGMGLLFAAKDDYEQAIDYFEKALLTDPQNPHVHYALAISYLKIDKKDKAQEHLNTAERLGLIIDPALRTQVGR